MIGLAKNKNALVLELVEVGAVLVILMGALLYNRAVVLQSTGQSEPEIPSLQTNTQGYSKHETSNDSLAPAIFLEWDAWNFTWGWSWELERLSILLREHSR